MHNDSGRNPARGVAFHAFPRDMRSLTAATEPLVPAANHLVAERMERGTVEGHTEVIALRALGGVTGLRVAVRPAGAPLFSQRFTFFFGLDPECGVYLVHGGGLPMPDLPDRCIEVGRYLRKRVVFSVKEIERLEVPWVLHGVVYFGVQLVPAALVLEQDKHLFLITAQVDHVLVQLDDCKSPFAGLLACPDVELIALAHHRFLVTFDGVRGQVADFLGKSDLEELCLGAVHIRPDEFENLRFDF